MPVVRALPGRLDIECRPGDPFALAMTFTAGTLTGATIAATATNPRTGASLSFTATKVGDVATVSLTDTQTTTLGLGTHAWEFTVNGVALVAGSLSVTTKALSSTANTVDVTISQSTAATVTVLGAPGSGGGGGGAVDSVNGQTGTVTLTAADVGAQPVDSDLTSIAALTTTTFGRARLTDADAAAARTALGLGTAATRNVGTGSGDVAAGDAPATAAAAAVASLVGAAPVALDTLAEIATALGSDPNFATTITTALAGKQPLDADLTAIAALATTSYGRDVLTLANAAALRTYAGVVIGTDVQAYDADLAAIAALVSAADKLPYATGAGTWALTDLTSAARSLLDDTTVAAMRTTLGLAAIAASGSASDLSTGTVPTARLGSGTANSTTFLRGDNTWATPSGGAGVQQLGLIESTAYSVPGYIHVSDGATLGLSQNVLYLQPFYVPESLTISAMNFRITGAGAASSVVRLGIYTTNRTLSTASLVLDAGTVAADSTGTKNITGLSTALSAGWHFTAILHNSSTTVTAVYRMGNSVGGSLMTDFLNSTVRAGVGVNPQTYGALPSSPTPTTISYGGSGVGTFHFVGYRWS